MTAVYFEKITSKKHGRRKGNSMEILSTSGNTYTFKFGLVGSAQNRKVQ
jgi:hypothetical protein